MSSSPIFTKVSKSRLDEIHLKVGLKCTALGENFSFWCKKTQEKNVETVKGRTGKAIPIFQVIRFPVKYSMILVTIQIEPLFIIFFCRMMDVWEAQEMEHATLRKFHN